MDPEGIFSPISEFSEEQSFIDDEEDDDYLDENVETGNGAHTASFREKFQHGGNQTYTASSFAETFHLRQSHVKEQTLTASKISQRLHDKIEATPVMGQDDAVKINFKGQTGLRWTSERTGKGPDDSSSSVTSGRITCGICLEDQQLPKLLPCMHSFCRHCLQQHINSNSNRGLFKCPLCRREIPEPRNGASGFEDNIYYNTGNKQFTKCQACAEKEGKARCLECCQNYCQSCARIHLNMANSKGHHLSLVASDGLESNLTPKLFCKIHRNKKLSYFCRDCAMVICGKCVIDGHGRHTCVDVATIAHAYRNELRGHLDSSDMGWGFVSTLEDRYLEIQRSKSTFQNDMAEEILKIENQAEKLKEKIDKASRIMVDSLTDREKHLVSKYEHAIDESETKLKWARNTLQTISQIVEISGDAELVSRYLHMKEVLHDIKDRVTLTEYDVHEVKFTRASPTNQDLTRALGSVEIKGPTRLNLMTAMEFPLPTLEPPSIVAICPVSESEAWIFYGKFGQIVDKQGFRGKPVETEDDVIEATVFMDKTVVIACRRRLLCLTEDRLQDELFELPARPNDVAVVQENIIVVFKDSSSIAVYTIEGNYLRDINKTSGTKVLKQPCKVAVNDKHEIFVSDTMTRQIAVFNVMGSFKTIFDVIGITPRVLQFDLLGNNLVVADEDENVHLLSGEGKYLQTVIAPRQDKIGFINSIGIDYSGDFWIGNRAGKVHVFYSHQKNG